MSHGHALETDRSNSRSFFASMNCCPCAACEVEVPATLPSFRVGSAVHGREGDGNDPQPCRRLRPRPSRAGPSAERRQVDSDAGASGLRGAARHRDMLPRLHGEVVEAAARNGDTARPAGRHSGLSDGVDQAGCPADEAGLVKPANFFQKSFDPPLRRRGSF